MGMQGEGSEVTPSRGGGASKRGFLLPGQVLGGAYEVQEQIGEGGMAIVYRAMQRSLNRSVAVKAMHPKFSRDQEFISRFEAEAGALAALSHPNIVSIIDRGNEGEVYYFVMEYVDGDNLDIKIIENRLTPNDWRHIVTACSSALEYVHRRGVVHRDIKPSNILIDAEGRVKIGDFGIAHIMGGDSIQGYQGPAKAVGTQHYMAPEQTTDPANVDHRADIYALGVAFYKMLTRQLPIGEFPAPSEVSREVPVAVDAVIFQAMAPSRDDRFQSVVEFCDEMQKALRDQTANITNLLNYRPAGGSMYSASDMRSLKTPPTGTPYTEIGKGKDTGSRGKSGTGAGVSAVASAIRTRTGTGTGTGTGAGTKAPTTRVGTKTGTGTGSKPGVPPPTAAGAPPSKALLIGAVALAIIAGIIAAKMLGSGESSRPAPVASSVEGTTAPPPPPQALSGSEREKREKEEWEKKKKEIMGSGAPQPQSPLVEPSGSN
jgi:serine/threonine-protein kinase